MAITAETRNSIIELVVTAFNAAPGTSLLTDLVAQSEGGASLQDIAATLTDSAEFKAIYPTFQTAEEFANEFLGNLVPEASAEALAEGVTVAVGILNGGGTRADIVYEAATFLAALSEADASFGSSAALFNNRVEVATHHTVTLELDSENITDLQNVLSSVTSDDATVQPAKDAAAETGGQQGQTITLTTGADAITGSAANDLIVATEATLSSADVLDGGGGTDTLRYASSGATAVSESGFESKNIEIVSVTSDAVGGTTFDLSGATGLSTVRNFNSSQNLTVSGLTAVTDVTLDNVGSPDNTVAPTTTVNYNAAATAGTNTQNVSLISNANANGGAIGALTANGIENFNVTTSGGSSSLAGIASTSLDTLTVAGDQNLTVTGMLVGADTVDASTFTGNLSVVLDSAGTAKDVAVTGGTGNDRADFSAGFEKSDSFDGGDGTDTIGVVNAVATGTPAGTVSNVEILDVTDAADGTIDMDNFSGVTKVILNAGIAAGKTSTIDDAVSGIEVELDETNTGSLVVDLKTDGSADEITVTVDRITGVHSITSINAADAETLNLSFDDDSDANTTAGFTVTSLTASDATTINFSGDADTTITNTVDPTTPVLATLNASTMTGDLKISGTNFSKDGATITLGSGDDMITFATAAGADTITLGDGKDTLSYNAVAQSDTDTDTVKDFVSGTDSLSLNFAGLALVSFAGNKSSFGQTQGALPGDGTANGIEAVYQVDDQILWVDVDSNGTLDNKDFRIKLEGVTALTAADIGLASSGASLTFSAAGANSTTGLNVTGGTKTTSLSDTINTTTAFLNGSTVNGQLGTEDTLNITTAAAVTIGDAGTGGTVTNTENLTLSDNANTIAFAAGTGIKDVTGGSGIDTINPANLVAGGTISTGGGADVVNLGAALASTFSLGDADDQFVSTVGAALGVTSIDGGAGTDLLNLAAGDNISAVTTSGIENLTLTGNGTYTMMSAQYTALTGGTVTAGGAGENITLSDAGTISTVAAIEQYVAAAAGNTINVGVAATNAYNLDGGAGVDTVNITAGWDPTSDTFDGGAGSDVVNISQALAASNLATGFTTLETINVTTAPTGALTIADSINAGGGFTFDSSTVSTGVTVTNTTTGANGAITINLGSGNDTVSAVDTSTANGTTINFGSGNDTLSDITATGAAGVLTLNLGISAAGNVDSNTIAATTADLETGDIIKFNGVTVGALAATLTASQAAGVANTVVINNAGGNTTIQLDANGNGVLDAGADVQLSIVGQALTTANFNIVGGQLVFV